MDIYKEIEKDLFYEYSKVFTTLTLADIKDWDRVIQLLITVTINVIKQNNSLNQIKKDGLNGDNQKESEGTDS